MDDFPGGAHTAIYVDGRPGKPGFLYDPGGNFAPKDDWGVAERGSSAYFEEYKGSGSLFDKFVNFQTDQVGVKSVVDTVVKTTEAEEDQIRARTGGYEASDPGPMNCASACNAVTRGVGPFPTGGAVLPSTERDRAQQAAEKRGGYERTFTGKKVGDVPIADKQKVYTPTGSHIRR